MELLILAFLIIIPGGVGAALHMRLIGKPKTSEMTVFTYLMYGFLCFAFSLALKTWKGASALPLLEAFGTTGSIFKFGVMEMIFALALAIGLSLVWSLFRLIFPGKDAKGGKPQ